MRLFFTLLLFIPFTTFSQNMIGGRILYHETADSATIFTHYVVKQTSTTYGITPTKWQQFNGSQSAKFELRETDAEVQSGTRAEITFPAAANLNRWYSFAVFFPGLDWASDPSDDVIMQWHQGGSATPALCFRIRNDTLYLRIMGNIWLNLDPVPKDKWVPYTMHIKHASDANGLIEIWRDRNQILDRAGQNMYATGGEYSNPNWKLGIYKSAWNGSGTGTTATDRRVILYDDIKMGNENASFREMCPNSSF
jgi:hypothetical protein